MTLQPRCLCGALMTFPFNRDTSHCTTTGCGVRWVRDAYGFWAEGLRTLVFTPRFAKKRKAGRR